jgi:DNA-binding CsgD family transcriptional regulator
MERIRVSGLSGPVVGRADEVQRLRTLVKVAVSGHGAAALIEGEPGIGKTTLLDSVAAEADRLGARVLRGAATEPEYRVPFSAIGSCLAAPARAGDPAAVRLAALLRGEDRTLAAAGAADREFVVTEAILELLDRWCTGTPVALLIDDLQWADASSLLVLGRMGRAIEQLPLLVVGACRRLPRAGELDGLLRSLDARGAVSLSLGPLPEPTVAGLVANLVGAPPGPRLLALVGTAAGNPMYVTELVDGLSRAGRVAIADGVATVTDAPDGAGLPQSLLGAVGRRLDFLSEPAREALRVAAVLGPGLNLTELATVLGTSAVAVWDAVSEAIPAGLLTESGDELVFRHELIRQALAAELPSGVGGTVQARAARALAAAGAPVERVAKHLLAGGDLDADAVDWLVRNADQVVVRAPGMAVDLLEEALARPGTDGGRAVLLRVHLARALLWAGFGAEAEREGRVALAGTPDDGRAGPLRWLLAHAAFQQGDVSGAIAEAERALVTTQLPAAEAARFHGFIAQCRLLLGQVDRADTAANRALTAAEASGDAYGMAYGLYIKAGVRLMEQRHEEGVDLADRALAALGTHEIQPDLQLAPQVIRGFCLLELDRLADADRAYEAGLRQHERAGRAFLTWHYMGRIRVRFLDGRWDDALAEIQAGLEVIDPLGMAPSLHSHAALIAMHRGDFTTHAHLVTQPETGLAGQYWDFLRLSARALAQENAGDPARALRELMAYWERGVQQLPNPVKLNYICAEIARLAATTGDVASAGRVAVPLAALVARHPAPSIRGVALLCRGVSDRDGALLLAAADAYREAGRPLYEGYAYENAAAVFAAEGRITDGRAALEAALDRYEQLDAGWDAARAESRLRQSGVRRRGARRRPRTGWESLTDTERAIADLVAQGLSNPDIAAELFLARRTVQSHVSRILAKLGLSSRVDLAAARSMATHAE